MLAKDDSPKLRNSTAKPQPNRLAVAVKRAIRQSGIQLCSVGLLAVSTADMTTHTLAESFPAEFQLSSLATGDGTTGFVLNGIDVDDRSGRSVSAAGDVNGDGLDDIIIGAREADPSGLSRAGESYVVFGRTTGFESEIELSSLSSGNGSNGFVLNGVEEGDGSGFSVSAAGDVNGDGVGDIIISALYAAPNGVYDAGESYVVFGRQSGFSSEFELSSLSKGDGSTGFVLNGIDSVDRSGWSVSAAGDVNGDGVDDLIIGAPFADPGTSAGESYVIFGRQTAFPAQIELSELATGDGSTGFVINGANGRDYSGWSVSAAGDVNGDGIDDLIIGANGADPNGFEMAGQTYVVFGRDTGFPAQLLLFHLIIGDGSTGFVLNGVDTFDLSSWSVSAAGDVMSMPPRIVRYLAK